MLQEGVALFQATVEKGWGDCFGTEEGVIEKEGVLTPGLSGNRADQAPPDDAGACCPRPAGCWFPPHPGQ